jgi:site-specific DNA recombinase
LFEAVQARLTEQANDRKRKRLGSEALLAGRIFDDHGNRMTPSHVRKRGIKYRYYLSSVLLHGQAEQAGSTCRVPAAEVEALVIKAVRGHLQLSDSVDDRTLIENGVTRVDVRTEHLDIRLADLADADPGSTETGPTLQAPWRKTSSTRRRELLVPDAPGLQQPPPIRAETRALLVASVARGRRWLNELIDNPRASAERIAKREGCNPRKVNMTISLAFLAPDLVKAAIEGRLPRGIGVARLADMPAEWSRQYRVLGLAALAHGA